MMVFRDFVCKDLQEADQNELKRSKKDERTRNSKAIRQILEVERWAQEYFKASWEQGQDLNLRPSGYEPDELPGCSTPR